MTDLNLDICKATISGGLGNILDCGFRLNLKAFDYIRRRETLIDIFRVEISRIQHKYLVTPSVFIGVPRINELYNTIFGRKRPSTSTTIGFGIDNMTQGRRGRYQISEAADFDVVVPRIADDFSEVAIPWFAGFHDVSSVDSYLNSSKPLSGSNPISVGYACKGLIAAHLAGNPDVGALAEKYFEHFKSTQALELADPIRVTADWLNRRQIGA